MGKKVLVIEDDDLFLQGLKLLLEMEGLEVIGARNGEAGLERAQQDQPDLILCDFFMPGSDGLHVLQDIRHDPRTSEIPYIAMSVDSSYSIRDRFAENGANAFLSKPFTVADLLQTIHRHLAGEAGSPRTRPQGMS